MIKLKGMSITRAISILDIIYNNRRYSVIHMNDLFIDNKIFLLKVCKSEREKEERKRQDNGFVYHPFL